MGSCVSAPPKQKTYPQTYEEIVIDAQKQILHGKIILQTYGATVSKKLKKATTDYKAAVEKQDVFFGIMNDGLCFNDIDSDDEDYKKIMKGIENEQLDDIEKKFAQIVRIMEKPKN